MTALTLCEGCFRLGSGRRLLPNDQAVIAALAADLLALDGAISDEVLRRLTPREEQIVRLRLKGESNSAIGRVFAVSGSRVGQLYGKAMMKLAAKVNERDLN